jgi:hypothetical protein
VTRKDATPGHALPKDVMPEATVPNATVPNATAQAAGTAPRADTAHPDTPGTAGTAGPAPRTDVATDGANAKEAGANGTRSSESSLKQVTVIPGVPRYHDADCILIRFMADDDMQKMTLRQATEAGCTPCRACQPGTGAD